MPAAWSELPDDDYERLWDQFYDQFQFRPGVDPETWPAILEPTPSVTIDISALFGDDLAVHRLEAAVHQSMVDAFPSGTALVALNWQHACFWFWPHRFDIAAEAWLIPPFPNGDYYIFLTDDMTSGIFGHPWERTICVFGEPLLGVLAGRIGVSVTRSR